MNNKTIYTSKDGISYLCLACVQYVPCNCTPAPKPAAKWTSKTVYTVRFTENVNYSGPDHKGDLEVEDRDNSRHFDLESIEEAREFLKYFEPYTREDGALIFSLDTEIVKWRHHYLNGELHHDEFIYEMEVGHAPKYVQAIARKMTA